MTLKIKYRTKIYNCNMIEKIKKWIKWIFFFQWNGIKNQLYLKKSMNIASLEYNLKKIMEIKNKLMMESYFYNQR